MPHSDVYSQRGVDLEAEDVNTTLVDFNSDILDTDVTSSYKGILHYPRVHTPS